MLILLAVMLLSCTKRMAGFARGLRQAMGEFRKASSDVAKEIDQAGFDTGRSLGGIHGKTAFEAMTTGNQNVELYDAAVSRNKVQIDHCGGRQRKKAHWKRLAKIACGIGIGILLLSILLHLID